MLIRVSPRFILNTHKRTVTELVSPRGDVKCVHLFHDPNIPVPIFRDRMDGWFFKPAIKLLSMNQDIAAVHIVTPLIEALGQRYGGGSGEKPSGKVFKDTAKEIFDIDCNTATLIYKGLRCGFAHHGFIKDRKDKNRILLAGGLHEAIEYSDSDLLIDPWRYVDKIRAAYGKYYSRLRENAELHERFIKNWNVDWELKMGNPGGVRAVPEGEYQ